ncbi:Uncharacterized protein Adt_41921 [Abeliophyllum distichum]|uniref:Uncharacterized protein n=1 Tax=Abeliophyllum distichum TaxID=126358 RepID=A0ABD1PQ74_9LAMI
MPINSGSGELSGAVVAKSFRELSPELVEVLPIRRIDTCTGEEISIAGYDGLGLVEGGLGATILAFVDRWAVMEFLSIVNETDLESLRQTFRVPEDIHFHVPEPSERAYCPREGCVDLHIQSFNAGMRLPLDPFYRHVLRVCSLAPIQMALNG